MRKVAHRRQSERLFVDVVHVALTRAFAGAEPLAPEAFVVNFSVGNQALELLRSHQLIGALG